MYRQKAVNYYILGKTQVGSFWGVYVWISRFVYTNSNFCHIRPIKNMMWGTKLKSGPFKWNTIDRGLDWRPVAGNLKKILSENHDENYGEKINGKFSPSGIHCREFDSSYSYLWNFYHKKVSTEASIEKTQSVALMKQFEDRVINHTNFKI